MKFKLVHVLLYDIFEHYFGMMSQQFGMKTLFIFQTEKKACFGPMKNLFSLPTAQTEKNLWKRLINQIGENI